jgi:hypothetical protein
MAVTGADDVFQLCRLADSSSRVSCLHSLAKSSVAKWIANESHVADSLTGAVCELERRRDALKMAPAPTSSATEAQEGAQTLAESSVVQRGVQLLEGHLQTRLTQLQELEAKEEEAKRVRLL